MVRKSTRPVVWKPQGTAPMDGRKIWVSDGERVWLITAHSDGSHNDPSSATLCKFWTDADIPDPPTKKAI
jgi:hypothetical protein